MPGWGARGRGAQRERRPCRVGVRGRKKAVIDERQRAKARKWGGSAGMVAWLGVVGLQPKRVHPSRAGASVEAGGGPGSGFPQKHDWGLGLRAVARG